MKKRIAMWGRGSSMMALVVALGVLASFGFWVGCQTATATMGYAPGWSPGGESAREFRSVSGPAPSAPARRTSGVQGPPAATAAKPSPPPMIPATFAEVAQKASPAVINISTTRVVKTRALPFSGPGGVPGPWNDLFKRFGGDGSGRPRKAHSLGSGFIVNPSGLAITNNHVIEGAQEIQVTLSDGREFSAKVLGRDPKTDLALIQIESSTTFPNLSLGNSDGSQVGDWVVAIGNPFGLDHTVTSGILSARGRVIGAGPYDDFLQTSASINPGNSGGPLLNLAGEVIGINTAIIPGGQGIGFAIPSNLAGKIVAQLQSQGKVVRGYLGVLVQELTPELAKSFRLDHEAGALVADITPGGPAHQAGILRGDVIVAINGQHIEKSTQLPRIVAEAPVGEWAEITVIRNGRPRTLKARIQEIKEQNTARSRFNR